MSCHQRKYRKVSHQTKKKVLLPSLSQRISLWLSHKMFSQSFLLIMDTTTHYALTTQWGQSKCMQIYVFTLYQKTPNRVFHQIQAQISTPTSPPTPSSPHHLHVGTIGKRQKNHLVHYENQYSPTFGPSYVNPTYDYFFTPLSLLPIYKHLITTPLIVPWH